MSNILNLPDGKVVLVLSKEEAEVLGTFRYKYVAGKFRPLYDALRGLPNRSGEFVIEKDHFNPDRQLFTDFIPGHPGVPTTGPIRKPSMMEVFAMMSQIASLEPAVTGRINLDDQPAPQNLPSTKWMIECNAGCEDDWVPSSRFTGLRFDSKDAAEAAIRSHKDFNFRKDTGRYRAVPATAPEPPKQEGWIVQWFNGDHNTWHSLAVTEPGRTGYGGAGRGVYASRNEAYRQMRKRSALCGIPLGRYRVVSAGTPDGAEKDRGHYIVQYWSEHYADWRDTLNGPCYSNNSAGGKYRDAMSAKADIVECGFKGETYRVKWYPSAS